MIHQLAKTILTVVVLLLATGASAAESFPAGPARADAIRFQLAVYYTTAPSEDPISAMRAAAARDWSTLSIVTQLAKDPDGMLLQARMETDVQAKYAPPSMASLGYFGRGLSKDQAQALQGSTQALQLNFAHPARYTMEGLRAAYGLAEQVARRTGGLLWDEETREVFTPDKWHELRLASWTGISPEVSKNLSIHVYKNGDLVRAVSLGMNKFGLPDIIVNQFPWSSNNSMGTVINLLAQALAEGTPVGPGGNLDLPINASTNKSNRERELSGLRTPTQSVARLALVKGRSEDGDPANRLVEITFSRYPGADALARQDAMLSALFGDSERVKSIRHNAELIAASQAAQMKLAGLRAHFARGLQPGETIRVKAPFARPSGGSEYMWVQVTSWSGEKIGGMLRNEPLNIPAMHGGQAVQVRQDKVFDYIHSYPDGRQEGDTTSKIIEKMNAAKTD